MLQHKKLNYELKVNASDSWEHRIDNTILYRVLHQLRSYNSKLIQCQHVCYKMKRMPR